MHSRDNVKLKRICPICNHDTGIMVKELHFVLPQEYALPAEYNLVCCKKCGFAFADSDADQSVYSRYYKDNNVYSEATKVKRQLYQDMHKMYMDVVELIQRLYPDVKGAQPSIIDVGCGGGELLYELEECGYRKLLGFDPSEKAALHLEENGIRCITGDILEEIHGELTQQFDVVVSTGVIEHIFDLNGYLRHLKELVREEGVLIVNCPDVDGYLDYLCAPANYFNHEHINYFSIISLDNLFLKYGFRRMNADVHQKYRGESVILAAYRRSMKCEDSIPELKKDEKSLVIIREYYKKISVQEAERKKKIERLKEPFVIWGAGAYTMQLMAEYSVLRRAEFIIDNNFLKQGMKYGGVSVVAPNVLAGREDATILIISTQSSADIVESIRKNGYENKIELL